MVQHPSHEVLTADGADALQIFSKYSPPPHHFLYLWLTRIHLLCWNQEPLLPGNKYRQVKIRTCYKFIINILITCIKYYGSYSGYFNTPAKYFISNFARCHHIRDMSHEKLVKNCNSSMILTTLCNIHSWYWKTGASIRLVPQFPLVRKTKL